VLIHAIASAADAAIMATGRATHQERILDGAVVQYNQDYIVPYLKKNIDHYLRVPEIMVSTLDGLAPLLGASVVARGYAMKLSTSHNHPRNMH